MDIKTRSAKVDGKKLPGFSRDLNVRSDQNKNNLNSCYNKLNDYRKSQGDAVSNKIEAKFSNKDIPEAKVKRDIIAENIVKQGKRLHISPVKRISATSNFIYEFNPFNAEQSRPLTSQTHLWRANSEQTLPHSKTNSASNFTKRKSSAVLPELNSRIDFVTIDPDSKVTDSSPTKNTCLPILGREDPTRTLNKQVDKEYEQNDIDREVENVKSAWQALRGEEDWMKGKDHIDSVQTKKLYEILEKMTCDIDRIQRNYMDSKANHYLPKSATNVLRTSSNPSLQEKAEIVRSVIIPDRKARIKSAMSRLKNVDSEIDRNMARVRFDEGAENILTDKQSNKNFLSSKYTAKKRSIHKEAHDIANDIKSVDTIASNICNKKQAVIDIVKPSFIGDGKMTAKVKSSLKEYLQHYSDNIHRSCSVEEKKEEHSRDMKPPTSDIANILANYNIGSDALYEHFEKYSDGYDSEDYASENNVDRSCSNTATNTTQVTSIDAIQENNRIHNNRSFENTELCNDIRPTKAVDARFFDIRKQSNVTNFQDNTFIKMGLNKDLSKDTLSQILQSKYLRKDLSL